MEIDQVGEQIYSWRTLGTTGDLRADPASLLHSGAVQIRADPEDDGLDPDTD